MGCKGKMRVTQTVSGTGYCSLRSFFIVSLVFGLIPSTFFFNLLRNNRRQRNFGDDGFPQQSAYQRYSGVSTRCQAARIINLLVLADRREALNPQCSSFAQVSPCKHGRDLAPFVNKYLTTKLAKLFRLTQNPRKQRPAFAVPLSVCIHNNVDERT